MTEWLNARTRPRAVASLLLIVTFTVGALAGAALNQVLNARQPAAEQDAARGGDRHRGDDHGREQRGPYDGLGLTPEQHERVQALLAERRRQMDSLWERSEPEMRAIMASSKTKIEAVLTQDQIDELERRRAERRERRAAESRDEAREND